MFIDLEALGIDVSVRELVLVWLWTKTTVRLTQGVSALYFGRVVLPTHD